MKSSKALTAGFAGALTLTVTHQLLHNLLDDAPRMDLMGEQALHKIAGASNINLPTKHSYAITMAGDLAGNTLYYALTAVGNKQHASLRGTLLGLVAGIGGVYLPKYLGLNNKFSNRTTTTKLLTVAIYTLGGLVAGKILSSNCTERK